MSAKGYPWHHVIGSPGERRLALHPHFQRTKRTHDVALGGRWDIPNRIPFFYGNGICIYVVIYLFTVLFTYVGYLTLRQYLAKCRSKYTIFMGPFGHGRRTFFGLQGFHPASFGNLSAAQKPVTNRLIYNSNPYKLPYNKWAPGFFSPYL